jgi:Cdc6-like AAA superfamily ATPase
MAPRLSMGDWAAKRFEANQLFTPSTPITVAELFAGRQDQAFRIVDGIGERGRHIILFGERGVGKTSLVQIIPYLLPAPKPQTIKFARVQCFPTDGYSSICKKIFKEIRFTADIGEGPKTYDVSEMYPGEISPDDFVREMSVFSENDIPVIVIDEFNELLDDGAPTLLANTIKALSDAGTNVTLIIVGAADSVTDLISSHASIERCTAEILMPRMSTEELHEIIETRLKQLGMTIEPDAKWKIINLAKGLPQYVHGLGKLSCFWAITERRLHMTEHDTDRAIENLLDTSEQTFKTAYETATRSNQPDNLFKHVLTACALAKADENGYFAPVAVREPLAGILGRGVTIATFQNHLADFAEKRGQILQRIGEQRSYRLRFRHPAMQPYVIMRGIQEGIVDERAKQALSSPEQGDLFPNAT